MSTEVINASKRESRGKRRNRRMREDGQIPAVLYGHGQESVVLAVSSADMELALRHRAHLVELKGDVNESALLKEVQWDAFGNEVLHVDFTRVDATEAVSVTLQVKVRGDAPGSHHGGVVEQSVRELEIECPANAIPEELTVSINELNLGDSIKAGQVELPAGATLTGDADAVVVACVEPSAETAVDEEPSGDAEPEVIGRKADDDEGNDE